MIAPRRIPIVHFIIVVKGTNKHVFKVQLLTTSDIILIV